MEPETPEKRRIYDVTKKYPDFVKVIRFNVAFEVSLGAKPRKAKAPLGIFKKFNENRAERHAKTTIHDIVICNDFDYFCTFTFDPKKVKSRYDIGLLKVVMHRWLETQRKMHGQFDYLILPEFHKDGAIHFHALFARFKGHLRDSGKKTEHGHTIYNFARFKYGFSTAVPIVQTDEDRSNVARYITKYVTKDMPTFPGKKRYWVSRGLKRPTKIHNDYHKNPHSKIYCAT